MVSLPLPIWSTPSREPVKKSHSLLKLSLNQLGTSQNMQIVDNGAPAQIKKVLAASSITRLSSLPPANMGKGMLNCHTFNFVNASLRSLRPVIQTPGFGWQSQSFVR
jgi:hypothetical protein